MKTLSLLLLLLIPSSCAFAQTPPAMTANFYLLQPEKWLDKKVSLNVARIDMDSSATTRDGFREVSAYTINNGSDGGYLHVLATPEALARIVTLCGTNNYDYIISYHPHLIQGTFIKDGNRYLLKVDK